MSLLDQIDGAMLAIVDGERRLVFAWYGGAGVNVYDEDGNEVDYFTISSSSKLSPDRVRSAIERVIAEHDDEG